MVHVGQPQATVKVIMPLQAMQAVAPRQSWRRLVRASICRADASRTIEPDPDQRHIAPVRVILTDP